MHFSMAELLVVLAIVLLLFGSKRLPELASGMGKALKNFKRAMEGRDEVDVTPTDKQVAKESSATPVDKAVTEAQVVDSKKDSKS